MDFLRCRLPLSLLLLAGLSSCEGEAPSKLTIVAEFPRRQITGVAVSPEGRMFVNVPYWPGQPHTEVLEVMPDGPRRLYPDEAWHGWTLEGDGDPGARFVCVQSVWADSRNRLWILDPASPMLGGVIPGGPKLVVVDLETDEVERIYRFDDTVAPVNSYLNDVRVDHGTGAAFITDSGTGALVVLDLDSGTSRRLLDGHPSTQADPGLVPVIGDRELRLPDGSVPQVHSDGIALHGGYVYYHALTGRRLYRVAVEALLDAELSEEDLAARVEELGDTVVTDGMLAGPDGSIYHTALERDAIVVWTPAGGWSEVVRDPRLAWPDSLSLGPDGSLYVTTSQIHLSPLFGAEGATERPYSVIRLAPDASRAR